MKKFLSVIAILGFLSFSLPGVGVAADAADQVAKLRKEDIERAAKLRAALSKRVQLGDVEAITMLATVKEQGDEAEPIDLAGAYDLFEQAATRGQPVAVKKMCLAYLMGRVRTKNVVKASGFCNKIDENDATFFFWGAYDYKFGLSGPKDLSAAQTLLEKAVLAGSGEAADEFGQMAYEKGDFQIARGWYRKAAAMGSNEAMSHLAAMTEQGQGGSQDLVEASWLYGLAAKRGDVQATSWLAEHPDVVVPESKLSSDSSEIVLTHTYGQGREQRTEKLTRSRFVRLMETWIDRVTLPENSAPQQYAYFECYVGVSNDVDLCITTRDFPLGHNTGQILQAVWGGRISLPEYDAVGNRTAQSVFKTGIMILFPGYGG